MKHTSRFNRYVSALTDLRLRTHARAAVTSGAAIVLVLGGLLAFDVPESFAEGGFFEALFGGSQRQRIVEPLYYAPEQHGWRTGGRHRNRHLAHRLKHSRHAHRHSPVGAHQQTAAHFLMVHAAASQPNAPTTLGRRSLCVRTCDGYFFPVAALGHNSQIPSHQATCDTLCPEAETKLFIMPAGSENIDEAAEARGGELYSQLVARIKSSDAKPASCGCHSAAGNPVNSEALLNDPTLRAGDTVVTSQGVRVFRGGAYPFKSSDFMSLAETRNLPMEKRGALAAIDRVIKTPRGRVALGSEHRREQAGHRRQQRSDRGLDFSPRVN
ncbi:MAG: DUF2865 domain-containing protein [Methylocystis sp.]